MPAAPPPQAAHDTVSLHSRSHTAHIPVTTLSNPPPAVHAAAAATAILCQAAPWTADSAEQGRWGTQLSHLCAGDSGMTSC